MTSFDGPRYRRQLIYAAAILITLAASCVRPTERPLAEPRVVAGKDFVSKKTLFHDDRLGGISSIAPVAESEVAVVGAKGVRLLDAEGKVVREFEGINV